MKYCISVEVVDSFVVEVNATSSLEALQKVQQMGRVQLEKHGEYVGRDIMVDDEVETKK